MLKKLSYNYHIYKVTLYYFIKNLGLQIIDIEIFTFMIYFAKF